MTANKQSGDSRPSKRRRTASLAPSSDKPDPKDRFDRPTSLALDHMIHDSPTHPLYQRNVDQVLAGIAAAAARRGESGALPRSLDNALALLDAGKPDDEGPCQLLVTCWSRKIMRELADGLNQVHHFCKDGKSFKIEDVRDQYQAELNIKPYISLDDEQEDSPPPTKRRSSRGSKTESKEAPKSGNASKEPPQRRASAGAATTSQQFATPQDSNSSSSEGSGSDEESDDDEEGSGTSGSDSESE